MTSALGCCLCDHIFDNEPQHMQEVHAASHTYKCTEWDSSSESFCMAVCELNKCFHSQRYDLTFAACMSRHICGIYRDVVSQMFNSNMQTGWHLFLLCLIKIMICFLKHKSTLSRPVWTYFPCEGTLWPVLPTRLHARLFWQPVNLY